MKKIIICLLAGFFLMGCADSKDLYIKGNLTKVEPYGWFDLDEKVEGVKYKLCVGNIVWSAILVETIVAPIVITGLALWEPVKNINMDDEATK